MKNFPNYFNLLCYDKISFTVFLRPHCPALLGGGRVGFGVGFVVGFGVGFRVVCGCPLTFKLHRKYPPCLPVGGDLKAIKKTEH